MKKVSIIYWSNGGNVELLANSIAEGMELKDIKVDIKHVIDATQDDVLDADAVAFGSPAMVNDGIERLDMMPFIEKLKGLDIRKKPAVLFGSCGWRSDEFMTKWQATMEDCGFDVIGKLVSYESLTDDEVKLAKTLGKKLSR